MSLLVYSQLLDIDQMLKIKRIGSTQANESFGKVLILCLQIWNSRNDIIFQKVLPQPARIFVVATKVGAN